MRTLLRNMISIARPRTLGLGVAAFTLILGAGKVAAQPGNPYPHVGSENPVTYSFTATTSGDIIAYFCGSGASYDEQLGMEVNGVLTTKGFGLDDHSSTVGQSFDLGFANAGDKLTFLIDVTSPNLGYVYSNPALNTSYDSPGDTVGHNHIFSMPYTQGSISQFGDVPSGTYVGFEDLPFPGSDFNYFDETYVFKGVTLSTPDSASTLALLGVCSLVFAAMRRRVRV